MTTTGIDKQTLFKTASFCRCQIRETGYYIFLGFIESPYPLDRTKPRENDLSIGSMKQLAHFWWLNQGTLAERESSIQLTSSLR
jgi:hypothetical protein